MRSDRDPRREPLRRHLNDELRAGKWIVFGYSETLRKRVRIEAAWRDELLWDDAGNMLDGNERYSDVLFYRADAEDESPPSGAAQ